MKQNLKNKLPSGNRMDVTDCTSLVSKLIQSMIAHRSRR